MIFRSFGMGIFNREVDAASAARARTHVGLVGLDQGDGHETPGDNLPVEHVQVEKDVIAAIALVDGDGATFLEAALTEGGGGLVTTYGGGGRDGIGRARRVYRRGAGTVWVDTPPAVAAEVGGPIRPVDKRRAFRRHIATWRRSEKGNRIVRHWSTGGLEVVVRWCVKVVGRVAGQPRRILVGVSLGGGHDAGWRQREREVLACQFNGCNIVEEEPLLLMMMKLSNGKRITNWGWWLTKLTSAE